MSDVYEAANVLNEKPERAVTWTTVNAGEAAFPGVPTPLSWTWGWWPTERGVRGSFAATGSFARAFEAAPVELADRILTIHHGNVAINLDLFRAFADGIPSGSGDDVERAFFGSVRPGVGSASRRTRYPVVALRMPAAAVRSRRSLLRLAPVTDSWWRDAVSRDLGPGEARALLRESQRRYAEISVPHVVVGLVAQGLYDQVHAQCVAAGMGDRAGVLIPGGQDEGRWLCELWDLAHGRGTLEDFLLDHGYHGPLEGELSSPTWRIDPAPLQQLLAAYARSGDREPPSELFARRERERARAEAEVLAALPVARRPVAGALIRTARAFMPLRESGRATFLRAYDVARHASRALGRRLAVEGVVEDAEDAFYLTFDELTAPAPPAGARELVAARRDLRRHYAGVQVPNLWTGDPTPHVSARLATESEAEQPADEGDALTGQGVSGGVYEGPVLVVLDPADIDQLDEGFVLVCRATDPSWAALFYVAGAVVTDIGGEMSHGAIVARELGLPAVANTGDGTRRLRTGERVRVDGSAGTVTRIA